MPDKRNRDDDSVSGRADEELRGVAGDMEDEDEFDDTDAEMDAEEDDEESLDVLGPAARELLEHGLEVCGRRRPQAFPQIPDLPEPRRRRPDREVARIDVCRPLPSTSAASRRRHTRSRARCRRSRASCPRMFCRKST